MPTPVVKEAVVLTSVLPLAPGRATHVAVDSKSNLYWVQECEDAEDMVMQTGPSSVSQVLFTAQRLMELLNLPGGMGNIESIAVDRHDQLFFFVTGGKGRTSAQAMGRCNPRTRELTILAGTEVLQNASGMGLSLPLARGTLLAALSGEEDVALAATHGRRRALAI